MAETKTLEFTQQNAEKYEGSFTSDGACVVELERDEQSDVEVWANIEGMRRCHVGTFRSPYSANIAIAVDVPAGMVVTIVSGTQVASAKIIGNA